MQVKDNGIVLFCYPKANTKGCTSQAVGLSEKAEELAAAGYKVRAVVSCLCWVRASALLHTAVSWQLLSCPKTV